MEHTVQITNLYGKLSEIISYHPNLPIQKWIGYQHIICQYKFRSARSAKSIRRNLLPDSYLELNLKGRVFRYFLEYDTGTLDKAQLVPNFMRYFEYFVYRDWQEKLVAFPSLIFLIDRSEKSLENIFIQSQIDLNVALRNRYNFSKSENVLWKRIGASENIRSINSSHIKNFLSKDIILDFTNSAWTYRLLK